MSPCSNNRMHMVLCAPSTSAEKVAYSSSLGSACTEISTEVGVKRKTRSYWTTWSMRPGIVESTHRLPFLPGTVAALLLFLETEEFATFGDVLVSGLVQILRGLTVRLLLRVATLQIPTNMLRISMTSGPCM